MSGPFTVGLASLGHLAQEEELKALRLAHVAERKRLREQLREVYQARMGAEVGSDICLLPEAPVHSLKVLGGETIADIVWCRACVRAAGDKVISWPSFLVIGVAFPRSLATDLLFCVFLEI